MIFPLARLFTAHILFGFTHELAHVAAALIFGFAPAWSTSNLIGIFFGRRVEIPAAAGHRLQEAVIRHAGWLWSLSVALAALLLQRDSLVTAAAFLTAVEAISSDLLLLSLRKESGDKSTGWFFCGNFGMILIDKAWGAGAAAKEILEKMIQVTMMRGAQTGGVVTYVKNGSSGLRGLRSRVVNSKRSDLSKLLRNKLVSDERSARLRHGLYSGVRFYAGHTRFATSSKATLAGCHPHQWSPPEHLDIYVGFEDGILSRKKQQRFEVFVTHNGDFDYLEVCGNVFELGAIQSWLVRATGSPMPCTVDSCAIAGVTELLRSQGSWFLSVRYAFLFAVEHADLDYEMPSQSDFHALAAVFEEYFLFFSQKYGNCVKELAINAPLMAQGVVQKLAAVNATKKLRLAATELDTFVLSAVEAFFENDLFHAGRTLLAKGKGSFGLCLTSSLDAHRRMVIAAQAQTMSVAFYPIQGLILYGSEMAATKAALGITSAPLESMKRERRTSRMDRTVPLSRISIADEQDLAAVRYDLDDLRGEVYLIDWGDGPEKSKDLEKTGIENPRWETKLMMQGHVRVVSALVDNFGIPRKFKERLTRIADNDLMRPLPNDTDEPIARDIKEIPQVLARLQQGWEDGCANRLTAWTLVRMLKKRLIQKHEGILSATSVDILVTGCEVSLWLGEQFAADLHMAFPKLVVKCVSANKILGLFGQDLDIPCEGHQLHEESLDLTDSIILMISHSGATFGTLNVAKLMQASSHNLFVITSEWDTQIAKQLRSLPIKGFQSRVFSTDIGVRAAEPCTLSVAATHQLLTQILMYLANFLHQSKPVKLASGCRLTGRDLIELEHCDECNLEALEDIVGYDREGNRLKTETSQQLRALGAHWSWHVLENPIAWILCFLYVMGTVVSGYPLVSGLSRVAGLDGCDSESDYSYAIYAARTLDGLIYVFLPQLATLLIRIVQGRALLHRMVARTVVIADCPWVAQTAEAFLSKIFACSYSAAGVHVYSGNPADHLLHRMTHRVTRGTLLAVGRPDGRLSALTSLEASICLSVNQATCIQSLGETCESITVGHNPFKLPMTAHAVALKGNRPRYLCEKVLHDSAKRKGQDGSLSSQSPAVLLGEYAALLNSKPAPQDLREMFDEHVTTRKQILSRGADLRKAFDEVEKEKPDVLNFAELKIALQSVSQVSLSDATLRVLFQELDEDGSGELDFEEFEKLAEMNGSTAFLIQDAFSKAGVPRASVFADMEPAFFGEDMYAAAPKDTPAMKLIETQNLSMKLYESRIASLQRAVAFFVLFHEMGYRVAKFWPLVSFGLLGYRKDRTNSILRIASTASPVSGSEVRKSMKAVAVLKDFYKLSSLVDMAKFAWKIRREMQNKQERESFSLLRAEVSPKPPVIESEGDETSVSYPKGVMCTPIDTTRSTSSSTSTVVNPTEGEVELCQQRLIQRAVVEAGAHSSSVPEDLD
eukprot:TRINITY_DN11152_c1_g1_i1.p1 TRINITY_DN11152_c1_g1~~TRINITY_DN11152_c1_g1_i1.p1  ORF type:complete len:1458 (-),score=249.36 TRINITY_DN11152_c1_g1_i1:158-4531(-)